MTAIPRQSGRRSQGRESAAGEHALTHATDAPDVQIGSYAWLVAPLLVDVGHTVVQCSGLVVHHRRLAVECLIPIVLVGATAFPLRELTFLLRKLSFTHGSAGLLPGGRLLVNVGHAPRLPDLTQSATGRCRITETELSPGWLNTAASCQASAPSVLSSTVASSPFLLMSQSGPTTDTRNSKGVIARG